MSPTYTATGVNLKSVPLGEADRILTILTREYGLLRVVAPGSRKPKAKLGGRSALFVVNQLFLSKGRSLDKIAQAEMLTSFPKLGQDLGKLTSSQYWAEIVLHQFPQPEPQPQLFDTLIQRLSDLDQCDSGYPVLVHLVYGILQFLTLNGIAPQVDLCCLTDDPITAEHLALQSVLFSPMAGGFVLKTGARIEDHTPISASRVQEDVQEWSSTAPSKRAVKPMPLSSPVASLLRHLVRSQRSTPTTDPVPPSILGDAYALDTWQRVERLLRHYVQYQTERTIRSAVLLDSYSVVPTPAS
jgi:DNA repair protein RecO (recombination protein O)